ncbi:MAG: stage III sporulation protein AF [Peptostreptococcaceae bacterium]
MLDSLRSWIITILIGAIIVSIVDMVLPKTKLKPYIKLVVNFIFVFIVITPIISVFSGSTSFEDKILKLMSDYNKEYIDSSNKLASQTGKDSLVSGYEDGLKQVLELKLGEYGYELEDIEFDGADINNIKLKEKNNSNKSEKEDIQSIENEKTEQVFKEDESQGENKSELKLNEDELKEDLVKILEVSIETIEID